MQESKLNVDDTLLLLLVMLFHFNYNYLQGMRDAQQFVRDTLDRGTNYTMNLIVLDLTLIFI